MHKIQALYQLTCAPAAVDQLSREIGIEQTIEVPESMIDRDRISARCLGCVEEIRPAGAPNTFLTRISYAEELSAFQLNQLLNLVYGNISLKRAIRLVDLELSDAFLDRFPGPRSGVPGIRQALGVWDRPLLATALKPRGLSIKELATLAREFALGGGDLVKDDHNLVDQAFDDFRRRVDACQQAVAEANRQTGRACLYFPNVSARAEELEQQLEYVLQLGIPGVMIAPMIQGLDLVRQFAQTYPFAFMAHPTFTGANFHDPTHGIDPGLLLGKLFRLIGCDLSIFPNHGGRFTFSEGDCLRIAHQLRQPWGKLAPAFPAPAGGMRYDNLLELGNQFGPDTVLLIGGALLTHSDSLRQSTRAFLDKIKGRFPERLIDPKPPLASACEIPTRSPGDAWLESLFFNQDFSWTGRESMAYKSSAELPFQGIRRVELVGKSGEKTAFDLRYFEIEPGGYSSLEKHRHTHVIIAARGAGILLSGEKRIPLKPFDLAYVPALQVHQLRNESCEPFGFFCIVDRERDRPLAP